MKPILIELPEKTKHVELHPLFDWHLGDSQADFSLMQKTLEHIQKTPNAYCVLGGDLMDSATAHSIGDTYGANLQPMEQLKECVKLFKPLADKGKILAVLHGNHENRIYKECGVDITALMSAQLGIADRYSATTAVLIIKLGRDKRHSRPVRYSVYLTHGSGGGRREGGKINRLVDYASIVDCDCYICGHTHLPALLRNKYFQITDAGTVVPVERLFVNAASALGYGGYGDVQGYRPASTINPIVHFDGTQKRMWAEL